MRRFLGMDEDYFFKWSKWALKLKTRFKNFLWGEKEVKNQKCIMKNNFLS